MKMNKILSLVTLAAAVFAAPATAKADGDIVDIRVMDMAGKKFGERAKTSGEACSPDNPVVAGEEVCVRVRMLVRNAVLVQQSHKSTDPTKWTDPQTFEIVSLSGGGVLPGEGPALGLRIGERNVWAEYSETGVEPWQFSGMPLDHDDAGNATGAYNYFTDFYFKYRVQPGDMGLPVKLLNSDLAVAGESLTSNDYAFLYVNQGVKKYRLVYRAVDPATQKIPPGSAIEGDAALHRSDAAIAVDWPGATYPLHDGNLAKEGLFVKTVDFDKVNASGGTWSEGQVWRNVFPGMEEAPGTMPALAIQGGSKAPSDIAVYVWSEDETVAVPVGDEIQEVVGEGGKKRHVLTVHIAEGATGATFALKGADGAAVDAPADICMSPTKEITYNLAGTPTTAYVKRQVKVKEAPSPTVQMRFENNLTTHDPILAGPDYKTSQFQLVFKVVPASASPVTVTLNAKANGGSSLNALYDDNILAASESTTYNPGGRVVSVTIPPGETVTRSFFVLGATEDTEAGVAFTMTSASPIDDKTCLVSLNRAGEEGIPVAKAQPTADATVSVSKGGSTKFQLQFGDSYKNITKSQAGYTGYTFRLLDFDTMAEIAKEDGVKVSSTGWFTFTAGKINLTPDKTYRVFVQATAPDGVSTTEPVLYTLNVTDSNKVVVSPVGATVGEGDKFPLMLSLNAPHDGTVNRYIFLKGATPADTAVVTTKLFTTGAYIDKEYREVTVPQEVQFLDGDTTVTLNAFLANKQSDPTDVTAGFAEGTVTFTVTNKPPVVGSVYIAGNYLTAKDNGKAFGEKDAVPSGIAKSFRFGKIDDVALDLDSLDMKWIIDGSEYVTHGHYTNDACVVCSTGRWYPSQT